jgi:putative heme iron utilization protein
MSDAPIKVRSILLGEAGQGKEALRKRAWAEIEAMRASIDVVVASIEATGTSERRLVVIYTDKQLMKE